MLKKLFLLLSVVSLLAFPLLEEAEGALLFYFKFGSDGTGDGQFKTPRGVVVDSAGNIYVADTDNYRIQKFDSSGNFVSKFGSDGTGDGQFKKPQGMALDSAGNIYVADTDNHRIQKFDSSGNFVSKFGSDGTGDGQFKKPQGVAADSAGNIYVTDYGNDRIQKFDSSGNFILKFGSFGSGVGQFTSIHGITVDGSGNVIVTDEGAHRIQVFDSSGNFVSKFGSLGSGDGQFKTPRGVVVDSAGNIYVADSENNRIQILKKDVADVIPPVITLNGPLTVTINQNWSYADAGATATDDTDGDVTLGIVTGGVQIDTSIAGTYTITYDVSDSAGNTAVQMTRTLVILDVTPPVITLNGPSTVTINQNDSYADAGATATDDTDGDVTLGIVTGGVQINTSIAGTYTITYDVTDTVGNAAVQAARTVIVEVPAQEEVENQQQTEPTAGDTQIPLIDDEAPMISFLQPDMVREATSIDGATITYGLPIFHDKIDLALDVTCTPSSGDTFPIGITTVRCTATDDAGNTSEEGIFTITVLSGTNGVDFKDTTAPEILRPENVVTETEDPSGTIVSYRLPATYDNVGVTELTCTPAPSSFFDVGRTKVTCTAKDAVGNTSQTSFTVIVKQHSSLVIHGWVKLIGEFWCNDQINSSEFVLVIQYLIDEKIIIVPQTELDSEPDNSGIPAWLKNVTCWWSQNQVSDGEFALVIQYLIKENIIRV